MICRFEDVKLTAWNSFKLKVQIRIFNAGKIIYYYFNAVKMTTWDSGLISGGGDFDESLIVDG